MPPVDIVRQLRWQDVADILILTFVLFRLYGWLRGTVALQVAVGMLTLVAAAFAATEAGLVLTAYVLKAIGAVAVLIAVVIFREEIRRALGKASPLRWWQRRRGQDTAAKRHVYEALAEALFGLARRRVGALVVLPREDAVTDHLTGGTRLDAVLSPQLLEAIFHPSSPLHDGAAVVDGGRVRLAGAFLPLSTSTELPAAFGTRHRAAVGLSEVCDAIGIAVSEERGEITLAVRGQIARAKPTPSALARQLGDLVSTAPRADARAATVPAAEGTAIFRLRRRQRIREALVRVAIFAAVVAAWYAIAGERGTVVSRTVPLELRGVQGGLALESIRPGEVTVQLRGPRRLLVSMKPEDLHASVVVPERPGEARVSVTVLPPPGVEIVRVVPDKVLLRVSR